MKPKDVQFLIRGKIKDYYNSKTVKEGIEQMVQEILTSKKPQENKIKLLDIITKDNTVSIEELNKLTK